ncbi:MAG: hypothetical protein DRQ88_12435 [Epsilonproteobacteria bacterium]|nr:MAG: hypothetical protein DRQ88_12435 [Campylobacterota bacterium]
MRPEDKGMCLILKPTELCNWNCEYCSSTNLVENKAQKLPIEKVFQFLDRFPKTQGIFVVGGDPLMMSPSYYENLLDYISRKNLETKVIITTNLWDFYIKPEKWLSLFKHPKFEVGTSFQYGLERKISKNLYLTEDLFIKIYNKFTSLLDYPLYFLSVVDDTNEHLAMDSVLLAKKLGTQCALTWAVSSGLQKKPFLSAKMFKIYMDIYHQGLTEYEKTVYDLVKKVGGLDMACPMNRSCGHWMRSLNPDGRYFFCGPLNDDLDSRAELSFEDEIIKGKVLGDVAIHSDWQYLKEECLTCDMFDFCNGCRKVIKDTKGHGLVEDQCTMMLSLRDGLLEVAKDEMAAAVC